VIRRLIPAAALLAAIALAVPVAASAASTTGDSEAAIVVISGDVDVARSQVVEGVFVANGDTTIAGEVAGDVIVLSGDVTVSGRIDGDLFTAGGTARLLPSAEVTGDVDYGDEHPAIALDARVHGDVSKQDWPDVGSLFSGITQFLIWLAVTLSLLVFGALLLLIAPRAADSLYTRSRERLGPTIAIGVAIAIMLPVVTFVAAITIVGLPLAIGIGLALLPLGTVAYLVSAYALGRRMVEAPRHRMLSFFAGLGALRIAAYVPILGTVVGIAALVFGLGLIGAAIGAAREPDPAAARTPGS
jgi:cytoskeletal protein CcmA (bactofilin family)